MWAGRMLLRRIAATCCQALPVMYDSWILISILVRSHGVPGGKCCVSHATRVVTPNIFISVFIVHEETIL